MFHYQLYEYNSLYGMVYTFPEAGDGLQMHVHEEAQKHNIIMMRGSVDVYGPGKTWSVTLKAGDVFDLLDEHHPHEICALEADTCMMGMFVNGKPEGENVPEEDRSGVMHRDLTHGKI